MVLNSDHFRFKREILCFRKKWFSLNENEDSYLAIYVHTQYYTGVAEPRRRWL